MWRDILYDLNNVSSEATVMFTLIEQTKSQQVVVVQHVLADLTLQLGELHLELRYFLYCLEVLLEFVLSEARDFEVAHEGDEQVEYE